MGRGTTLQEQGSGLRSKGQACTLYPSLHPPELDSIKSSPAAAPGPGCLAYRSCDAALTPRLASRGLGREEGLLILPCAAVHTFGMAYAIDAVFLDARQRICRIVAPLPPWRIAVCPSSRAVLELSAGQAEALGLEVGQSLTVLGEAGRP
ncbi:DUF192 domain-containing protein [Thiobacter aerophilum]|uniref:DUF192 domain-containing protein n=1 Tax=Thiobacter aerophilum TaxID=3121275 RepID=A0ABV0EER6_9BURK